MSTYTVLTDEIVFCGETLDSKYKVADAIEEERKILQMAEQELYSLVVMTEPQKFLDKDDEYVKSK